MLTIRCNILSTTGTKDFTDCFDIIKENATIEATNIPTIKEVLRIMEKQYKSLLGQKWCVIKGPYKPKKLAFVAVICYNCGKPGHMSHKCQAQKKIPGADYNKNKQGLHFYHHHTWLQHLSK